MSDLPEPDSRLREILPTAEHREMALIHQTLAMCDSSLINILRPPDIRK